MKQKQWLRDKENTVKEFNMHLNGVQEGRGKVGERRVEHFLNWWKL